MNPRRLFWSQAIMLLAVATPLALAESGICLVNPWCYWAAAVLGVLFGWWRTVHQDHPLFGPLGSRIFVVSAFLLLIYEYVWIQMIPVVALSHFMTLVCVCKLLQRRSYRDDAQLFVLSLLMLVVAAIISGNLLFPTALAIYMTVGIDVLLRFHLSLEHARVMERNRQIAALPPVDPAASRRGGTGEKLVAAPRWPLTRASCAACIWAMAVGAGVFMLCPRAAPGFLRPFEGQAGTRTGLSSTVNFNFSGVIKESERPVMHVQLELNGAPAAEILPGPYFRAVVQSQYREDQSAGSAWEWKRPGGSATPRIFVPSETDESGTIVLLPGADVSDRSRLLVQHFWLEPSGNPQLFTCYPAVELRFESHQNEEVKKRTDDQVVEQAQRSPTKPLRYSVVSPLTVSTQMVEALDRERGGVEPKVLAPDGELPRAKEIQTLIEELRKGLGSLDEPVNRSIFAQRVQDYLRSNLFTYTLNPPSELRAAAEPVGEFLIKWRQGYCEYFAHAMTVVCQLAGVPARVVSGYCGGDYNAVGHFYVVRQRHAHAWVEVYIPGQDWVTFDPTPAAAARQAGSHKRFFGLYKYIDFLQFHWATFVVSYDPDQRRVLFARFTAWLLRPVQNEDTVVGAVAAFVRELFGWRLNLKPQERLIYWVFTLLVVALVVLMGYVFTVAGTGLTRAVVSRLHRPRVRGGAEAEFYHRFCHRIESWGLTRRTGQTPAEFAEELAARLPICTEAPHLVQAYYDVAFGGHRLTAAGRSRIEAFLARLKETDRTHVRLALQPASIRAEAAIEGRSTR